MIDAVEGFHSDVSLARNDAAHRYELRIAGDLAVTVLYRELPGHMDFLHTETGEAYRGKGLAKVLARYALDDVVASGKRIIPHCPFVAKFLREHSDRGNDDYTQCTDWPQD
ncbi:MAG: GNAT family N-acetyltransferase [Actinomycetales bacterium]|jgi:hypothetical protein